MKNINQPTINKKIEGNWINRNPGPSILIAIILILMAIGAIFGDSQNTNSNSNQDTNTAPMISEQTKQALADTFCENRNKKYIKHLSLDDFSAMIEAGGKEITIHNTYQVPTAASCRKVAEECLNMWPQAECQEVAETKIWIGMSENQLYLSWGVPDKKNDTVGSWGINTQWIYGDYSNYVYLKGNSQDNLTVYSWQN